MRRLGGIRFVPHLGGGTTSSCRHSILSRNPRMDRLKRCRISSNASLESPISDCDRIDAQLRDQRQRNNGPAAGLGRLVHVPAFVTFGDLSRKLKTPAERLLKVVGAKRSGGIVRVRLSNGKVHEFQSLRTMILPFEDAQLAASAVGKCVRFLNVEPTSLSQQQRRSQAQSEGHSIASVAPAAGESIASAKTTTARPVIVLLGHFDHGKTTLLDAMLGGGSAIVARERGGITQEIRARSVQLATGAGSSLATVIDTPGQDIFYRMRNNGAAVADAAVLVVDATQGICQQTGESVGIAEELGLPILVAINKMDLVSDAGDKGDNGGGDKKNSSESDSDGGAGGESSGGGDGGTDAGPLRARLSFWQRRRLRSRAAGGRNPPPAMAAAGRSSSALVARELWGERAAGAFVRLEAELREFVVLEDAPIMPLSAQSGAGLTQLREALVSLLAKGKPGVFRRAAAAEAGGEKEEPAIAPNDGQQPGGNQPGGDLAQRGVVRAGSLGDRRDGPAAAAAATVLDLVSDARRGQELFLLVHWGAVKPGDWFVSGLLWGYVRALFDERGAPCKASRAGEAARAVCAIRSGHGKSGGGDGGGGGAALVGDTFHVLSRAEAEAAGTVRALGASLVNHEVVDIADGGAAAAVNDALDSPVDDEAEGEARGFEPRMGRFRASASGGAGLAEDDVGKLDVRSAASADLVPTASAVAAAAAAAVVLPALVVIKADTAQGLATILDALGGDEADGVHVVRAGIGAVTQGDVAVAMAAGRCLILAFRVRNDAIASKEAARAGVRIARADTIQKLIDAAKRATGRANKAS